MEDNIKIGPKEEECEGERWIHLTQERDQCRADVNTVMDLRVP
jgi:hypothetical protein